MIKTAILEDGRTHTWSDLNMMVMREDGVLYEDAVDVIVHAYTETDTPINNDATEDDYKSALNELGVDTSEEE